LTIDIISIFDCLNIESDKKFVFVLMSFEDERTKIYKTIVKPLVEEKGFECWRADDLTTNTKKINEIIRNIWSSQFIIADITGPDLNPNLPNPNVMYELGYANAMNKEVIMIYEKNKQQKDVKFPFDIGYLDIIVYESDPSGGMTLRQKLEKTIDYVKESIAKPKTSVMKTKVEESEDYQFKYSIISNFQIRVRRIDYLTFHLINQLLSFKMEHTHLLNLMEEHRVQRTEENHNRIKSQVRTMSNNNNYYYTFARELIKTSSNFISNGWIVNKFLDYFAVFSIGLKNVESTGPSSSFEDFSIFTTLKEHISSNLSDIDFCIDALNENWLVLKLSKKKDKFFLIKSLQFVAKIIFFI
jgi:nucleoside 2-deoxyribosyltransferase